MQQADDDRAFLEEVPLERQLDLVVLVGPEVFVAGMDAMAAEVAGGDEVSKLSWPSTRSTRWKRTWVS